MSDRLSYPLFTIMLVMMMMILIILKMIIKDNIYYKKNLPEKFACQIPLSFEGWKGSTMKYIFSANWV